jgi:hypothetical protein
MEKISTDAEKVIKLLTPKVKIYLKDVDQHPPYNFSLMRDIENRIHKNWGKKDRKKKMLHELLDRGFIRHFWFMSDCLALVLNQEMFVEYYDKYLAK